MQEPGVARPQRDPSDLRARSREALHTYDETQAVLDEMGFEW